MTLGLRIVPSIVNGGFDAQRVSLVVNDPARRAQHIADILALVNDNDYDGIDIDYESLNPTDRDAFSLFIEELALALHAEGKLLSIAVHAKTDDAGAWSGAAAQDWTRLGAAVDSFKIMTYDYHNGASEAGPIAPLDWVDAVLSYAATVVPPEKTSMGVPVYGYNWTGSRAPEPQLAASAATGRAAGRTAAARSRLGRTDLQLRRWPPHRLVQRRRNAGRQAGPAAGEASQCGWHRHLAAGRRGSGQLGGDLGGVVDPLRSRYAGFGCPHATCVTSTRYSTYANELISVTNGLR